MWCCMVHVELNCGGVVCVVLWCVVFVLCCLVFVFCFVWCIVCVVYIIAGCVRGLLLVLFVSYGWWVLSMIYVLFISYG